MHELVFVIGSINSARFAREPAWESCVANKEATVDLISFPTFRKFNKCRYVYIKVSVLEKYFHWIIYFYHFAWLCINLLYLTALFDEKMWLSINKLLANLSSHWSNFWSNFCFEAEASWKIFLGIALVFYFRKKKSFITLGIILFSSIKSKKLLNFATFQKCGKRRVWSKT